MPSSSAGVVQKPSVHLSKCRAGSWMLQHQHYLGYGPSAGQRWPSQLLSPMGFGGCIVLRTGSSPSMFGGPLEHPELPKTFTFGVH